MKQLNSRLIRLMLVGALLSACVGSFRINPIQTTNLAISNNTIELTTHLSQSQLQGGSAQSLLDASLIQVPLAFIQNQGQMDSQVAYYLQGQDNAIYFASNGLIFALTFPIMEPKSAYHESTDSFLKKAGTLPAKNRRWILNLDFLGASEAVSLQGESQAQTVISYFKGSPEEWHTGLPAFHRLVYRDLWPGIDLVYSGTQDRLKYEFVVKPGADPGQIRLAYRGVSELKLGERGQMEVITPYGSLQDEAPTAYQVAGGVRTTVVVSYDTGKHKGQPRNGIWMPEEERAEPFSFQVSEYDHSLPLIIDPAVLIYCGYIGGSGSDVGTDIALDGSGAVYLTGRTLSDQTTFPVNLGPDLTYNAAYDAFVAKVSADGTELVYAGYIGGSGDEDFLSIAVDSRGAAYIAGTTLSDQATFPVVGGPDLTYNGGEDAFVARLRPDGMGLDFAGYIGGVDYDYGTSIAVDAVGAAYITGFTASSQASFPVSVGPDLTYNGWVDAFVAKVRPDGAGLVYAGYIGGSGAEYSNSLAIDETGAAYVAGNAASDQATFPVKVGPDLTYNGGEDDAFVSKVNPEGTGLVYSGYIGGAESDQGIGIAVDKNGAAYLTGKTESDQSTFPVSGGPDLTYNGGFAGDAFAAKVKSDGSGLDYAGYIGGNSLDYGFNIAVDKEGAAYATGFTGSDQTTFPVSGGPDLTYNGGDYGDAFIVKLRPDGKSLEYGGYIGGTGSDMGFSVAVDEHGAVYVVGNTTSDQSTFPVSGGPDLTYNGGTNQWGDAFVAKIVSYRLIYIPAIFTFSGLGP